ncbi:ribonuclease III [Candidatus Falkowbacteria bacterium CG10_big_fil_rev_8_21_14_0_10_37_14]|uniref:Ribonuclease 3 n=1 Tax=Candidatus Falkowbacteria bacterium CG10_big_fil_rev_8_21_14_0_10_37_14 TaxID=1974561 RepID=A0A2M6WS73_9BACT|nr:ribonuclease III [Candidatus Falkowbacteria bacterium]PIT95657.1 MAG: ribonuclease III [Candidatus Falkowbacteria bacterium CG10_big_fil_rev_8_21_14_0_10_37_14]
MPDFNKLQTRLQYTFKDLGLLKQSMVHRSYINEHPDFPLGHNERLEFLGDAVLEIVVTEHLYLTFPDKPEGELTDWRASLVNAKILSEISKDLNLEDCLFLSKGEAKDADSKARQYILANAIEALIGAIYLDGGIEAAKPFIHREIINHLDYILANQLYMDPKSRFQEKSQEIYSITPHYKILDESGPDHAKNFTVGLYIDEEQIAVGHGSSKHEAQVDAAASGLKVKTW